MKNIVHTVPAEQSVQDALLISCPGARGGLVYLSGCRNLVLSPLASTGIYADQHRFFVARQEGGGSTVRVVDHTDYNDVKLSETDLDIHDLFVEEDRLYVVVTEQNAVFEMDLALNMLDRWGVPGEHDSAHMNSVTIYQGRLMASVFGRFEKHREYKNGTRGLGEVIDIKSGETFIAGLSQPHSLTVIGKLLYLCNSEEKELRIYCGTVLQKSIALPGYARGIAVGKHHLYVGLSLSRNMTMMNNSTGVEPERNTTVAVLNTITFEIEALVPIPFPEIYDIRVVNDLADLVLKTVCVDDHAGIIESYDNLNKAYEETLQANKEISRAYEETLQANKEIRQAYEETLQANKEISRTYEETLQANKEIRQAYEETLQANKEIRQAYEQTRQAYEETLRANKEISRAYEETLRANKEISRAYEETLQANKEISQAYEETLQANKEIGQAYEETLQANKEIRQAYEQTRQAYEETLQANKEIGQAYEHARRDIDNG